MKNQRNHARHLVGLILTLAGLIGWITLALASTNVAASVKHSYSASTSTAFNQENLLSLNRWSSNGPDGANVLSLAVDRSNPAIIYAGTTNGVFKSTDGGESWTGSLPNIYVRIVAIAPSTPTTLYAASDRGIYKSTDSGGSWNAVNNGLENQRGPINILAMAIDPTNPNIAYVAGPDIDDPSNTYKAIYKSTDGGTSWSITKHSIRYYAIHNVLAIDPISPNIIYAAGSVGNGTVWKSIDNGRSWSIVDVGPDYRSTVLSLVIDPTNTNVIYAGTSGQGLYRSIDGGATWSAFRDGLPFYNTRDDGQHDFFGISSIMIDPINPSIIYAGTHGGVFKSSNGGSWNALSGDLTNLGVNALAINSNNPKIICAGTYSGIFKTVTNGASWKAYDTGLRGVNIYLLAVNPGNANVYANANNDTFKSTDNGGSWTPTNFYPLAFDPHNPNTIYARVAGHDGLFKSTNGGQTWSSADPSSTGNYVSLVVIDPNNTNIIYALADGLYKSTDGGGSWNAVGDISYFYFYLLVIDPRNSQTLYAFYDDCYNPGVYKSLDGGATWKMLGGNDSTFLYYVTKLVIDPVNTSTLYASACASGADGCGIYKSTDSGGSWSRIGAELFNNSDNLLVIDPVNPNNVYVGNYEKGVFKSSDGGASWNPLNDGLTNLNVNALAIDATGNFLHAGTSAGVFDYQSRALPVVQFSAVSYNVGEGDGRAAIIVTRTGDTTSAATVSYATSDTLGIEKGCQDVTGIASSRCDYATTVGTLRFAAGETSKTIFIPIVDDAITEGNESFSITLSNPTGASLDSTPSATIAITDNDATQGANPIDSTAFFVRQHYIDFLGREPDPASQGWQDILNNCGKTVQQPCDRIEVSSDFFRSPEFQARGYFIYRFYSAMGKIPHYSEFMPDFAKVNGFLNDQQLEENKAAFVNEFMTRPEFQTKYGSLTDPTAYVDALLQTVGVPNHPTRGAWITALTNGTMSRTEVLRGVAESAEVYHNYYNEAFVVMQYFGYLRRDPDIKYLEWIQTLNQTGDYRVMINGFVNSVEYRQRFGQ